MQRIHHLDSLTIDKIAAGEVIDVPASCVKELMENALDAGAEDILIEVQLGGRELIRVKDTGCGMCREDVLASIERHATSKIRCVEDLEKLCSMGFRGEALASIVAISRVRITTAERKEGLSVCEGTTLCVEGGEVKQVCEVAAIPGTTVEVTDLCYNVPARRKFLKSPSKDTQDIIKTVTCLALAWPQVSIKLIVDGKEVIAAQKQATAILRAQSLLKESFGKGFVINHEQEGFCLHGILADPQVSKTNRTGQYLFVNGRYVTSLPISYAVKGGFGTTIDQNKHPQFVLHLTLDQSTIDINVHPQKKEIRFADEEWVRSLVQEKVSESMFGKRTFSFRKSEESWTPFEHPSLPEENSELFSLKEITQTQPSASFGEIVAVVGSIALIRTSSMLNTLTLLDLKSAMKAVLFQELRSAPKIKTPDMLLIPITVECTDQEAAVLSSMLSEFEAEGFLIRAFGPSHFLVEAVPHHLKEADVARFILEALHFPDLLREKNQEKRSLRLSSLYVSLMKSLQIPISKETAQAIYTAYLACGSPKLAPDGLPCASCLTDMQLKDLFHGK
jgi:DNA mismatch repair protein MutL